MAKRVVLAYSGGLDTSIAVRWMREEWGVEVIACAVDVGQLAPGEEDMIRERAPRPRARSRSRSSTRATSSPRDFLVPALQANALYEGKYPLVSALSRPVIVEHLVAVGAPARADAVGHGCTGKGNDQVRFEVSSRILAPDLDVHGAGARVGPDPRRLHRARRQVGDPDLGVEGEAVLDRREHVGPRHRVRCAREPVVGRARGAVHAHPQRQGRAERIDRDRRRLRKGCAGLAERPGHGPRRAHRDDRRRGRRLRLGPHRHGREPARRHQEPRGVRVPGVAVADPGAQGSRRHHPRTRPRPREATARDPRRRAHLRRYVARAAHARAAGVRRLDAGARHRRGAAPARTRSLRRGRVGARRAVCTTTTSRPTTPTTPSATRTPRASSASGASRPRRGRDGRARGPRDPTRARERSAALARAVRRRPGRRAPRVHRQPAVRPTPGRRRSRRVARPRADAGARRSARPTTNAVW